MLAPDAQLDGVFSALANPVRRAILAQLAQGPASVGDLHARHEISLPAISRHLRVLEEAHMIERRDQGRFRQCSLSSDPMREAASWLETHVAFWEQSLARLDRYLNEEST